MAGAGTDPAESRSNGRMRTGQSKIVEGDGGPAAGATDDAGVEPRSGPSAALVMTALHVLMDTSEDDLMDHLE